MMKVVTVLLLLISFAANAGTELTIYNVSDDEASSSFDDGHKVAKITRTPSSKLKPINAAPTETSFKDDESSDSDDLYESNHGDREMEIMDIINELEHDL